MIKRITMAVLAALALSPATGTAEDAECQGCYYRLPGPVAYCYFGTEGLDCAASGFVCATVNYCGLSLQLRSPSETIAPDGTPVLAATEGDRTVDATGYGRNCAGAIVLREASTDRAELIRTTTRTIVI